MLNNFAAQSDRLRDQGIGRPVYLLDLDSVDLNIAEVVRHLGDQFRIVTKSLPCLPLLKHVMDRANTQKLMAFHLPYLPILLTHFTDADILLGKPFLPNAVNECLDNTSADQCLRVQWLVDSKQRLQEHLTIAQTRKLTMRISIEIDIGLHRGGIATVEELHTLLDCIVTHPELTLSGLMGYDAHVPHYPMPDKTFQAAMAHYQEMIDAVRTRFPDQPMTFNSGGSSTYQRFEGHDTVNDVASGSAVVLPTTFTLPGHQAAAFIAAPVIRKFKKLSRANVKSAQAMSIYLYGGGWAADVSWPNDMTISAHADPLNQNLLPNQSLYETVVSTPVGVGDFVFLRPHQGDSMFQFEDILVLRDGHVADTWQPLPRRY